MCAFPAIWPNKAFLTDINSQVTTVDPNCWCGIPLALFHRFGWKSQLTFLVVGLQLPDGLNPSQRFGFMCRKTKEKELRSFQKNGKRLHNLFFVFFWFHNSRSQCFPTNFPLCLTLFMKNPSWGARHGASRHQGFPMANNSQMHLGVTNINFPSTWAVICFTS